ncbi:MAG TPA: aspartyl protease family protein [Chthoniobacteraceae bacterium]|nr:aspartyl protease family protein [Chthoniobacteraceae bacterium]
MATSCFRKLSPARGWLLLLLAALALSACQTTPRRVFDPGAGIPFEYEEGLILVEVDAGRHVLHFAVDTGAGSTVLSAQAAWKLRLKGGDEVPVYGVGTRGVARRVSGFDGSLGGIPLRSELFALNLRRKEGRRPLDGLIGQDFFKGRIVEIDYAARRLFIRDHPPSTASAVVLPIRYRHDAMCVPVGVNDRKPEWTRLDTGCVTALEWGLGIGRDHVTSGARRDMAAVVNLGRDRHEGVLIGWHPQRLFPEEAGLLGNGLLSHYRVTIDEPRMRLILTRP